MSKPSALEIDQRQKAAFIAGVDFGTDYYNKGCLGTLIRERGYREWRGSTFDDGEGQAAALSEMDRVW